MTAPPTSPQHLLLPRWRAEFWHLAQFCLVGASGVVVNLGTLTICLKLGFPLPVATAFAIATAMLSNFALNRRFTFAYSRHRSVWGQLLGFCTACSIGAVIQYATTLLIATHWPHVWPQAAAFCGIVLGTAFNFLGNRLIVFKKNT